MFVFLVTLLWNGVLLGAGHREEVPRSLPQEGDLGNWGEMQIEVLKRQIASFHFIALAMTTLYYIRNVCHLKRHREEVRRSDLFNFINFRRLIR
jgi:hypothetical protein